MQYSQLRLWRWLLHSLSKGQSISTATVLFRTTITWTIMLNRLIKWLRAGFTPWTVLHPTNSRHPSYPNHPSHRRLLSHPSYNPCQKSWNTCVCFPLHNVDLGMTVVSVLQNTCGSTLGRERAHYSENKSGRSKSQECSGKFKRSGVCFSDLWWVMLSC